MLQKSSNNVANYSVQSAAVFQLPQTVWFVAAAVKNETRNCHKIAEIFTSKLPNVKRFPWNQMHHEDPTKRLEERNERHAMEDEFTKITATITAQCLHLWQLTQLPSILPLHSNPYFISVTDHPSFPQKICLDSPSAYASVYSMSIIHQAMFFPVKCQSKFRNKQKHPKRDYKHANKAISLTKQNLLG